MPLHHTQHPANQPTIGPDRLGGRLSGMPGAVAFRGGVGVQQGAEIVEFASEDGGLVEGEGVHRLRAGPRRIEAGQGRAAGQHEARRPVVNGQRAQQHRPPVVPPGVPVGREQGFQVVQHDQQGVLPAQCGQHRGDAAELVDGGDPGQRRGAGGHELQLPGVGEPGERKVMGVRVGRRRPVQRRRTGAGVPVGQFQGAGGLSAAGHPVEQHGGPAGGGSERGGGPRHRRRPADEPGGFRVEVGRCRVQPQRLPTLRRDDLLMGGVAAEERRGGQADRGDGVGELRGRFRAGRVRKGAAQRRVQRQSAREQPLIQRGGEPDRELVAHWVAHGQHRTAQRAGEGPGQPGP